MAVKTIANIGQKSRLKPIYKKFIRLRENVQSRTKILNFKREKWQILIQHYRKKFKRYNKIKRKDQNKYSITKFPRKGISYKKRYRDTLHASKRVNLFYGGFLKKKFKKLINLTNSLKWNKRLLFLLNFEKRLDVVLYRANFSGSVRQAQQLILHSKIKVNGEINNRKSHKLAKGDLISLPLKDLYLIKNLVKFPKNRILITPPKHLIVNYKTLQIIFDGITDTHFASTMPFKLHEEKITLDYIRQ